MLLNTSITATISGVRRKLESILGTENKNELIGIKILRGKNIFLDYDELREDYEMI